MPRAIGRWKLRPGTRASKALASAVRVKETSTRRVGVDPASGEIVVFDEHLPGRFHGHVRSWEELTPAMQHALEQAGLVTKRGRIIEG
jgi:filamentous hemagglutinin